MEPITLTEKDIEKLENDSRFHLWEKENYRRLYINPRDCGLELYYYNTGNVCSAYFNGEKIANNRGASMSYSKIWIDLVKGNQLCFKLSDRCGAWNADLRENARNLIESVLDGASVEA